MASPRSQNRISDTRNASSALPLTTTCQTPGGRDPCSGQASRQTPTLFGPPFVGDAEPAGRRDLVVQEVLELDLCEPGVLDRTEFGPQQRPWHRAGIVLRVAPPGDDQQCPAGD